MTVLTPANAAEKFAGMELHAAADVQYGFCGGIYGPAGVGKTTLAGTIANSELGRPALVVDAEGGAEVVKHLPHLSVVSPTGWSQIAAIRTEYARGNRPYKSIIFDNLSEIQWMHMRSIVPEGQQPEIKHYGKNVSDLVDWVRFWRDQSRFHGINVVFIMWDTMSKDNNGFLVKHGVQLRPKFAEQFPGIVNFVGLLTVSEKIPGYGRILDLSPNPKQDSKFRRTPGSPAMKIPHLIANPDLGAIVDSVKGGKAWDVDRFDPQKVIERSKPAR